jgi:predicted enzyme related to lactoylglutathione lyase
MPNPVVYFEVTGPDPAGLRAFYQAVFGWSAEVIGGDYALVETESHTHDESGGTTYTGADAHMNDGVLIGASGEMPTWRYVGESQPRYFLPGVGGGIGPGAPRVTFSIQVPDLEATLESVEAAGGTLTREIREVAPGVVTAEFSDPAGNVIGLVRAPQAD